MVVFQLNQPLQLVQLTLQVSHAAFQFFIFTAGRIQAFLGHRQLVVQSLAITRRALDARLGGFGRDQAQVVLRCRLRRRCAGLGAFGRIQLLAPRCLIVSATAPLAPGRILRGHFGDRLGLRQTGALYRVRHAQYLAGLHAVDVAVDKGSRVQCLDRQHGLLDRAAIAIFCGDFPQGVARSRGVFRRLGHTGSSRRGKTGCRGAGLRGFLLELGRVQQDAVVTHQPTIRPLHLQQEAYIGIGQWLARGDTNHAATAGVEHRGKGQLIEERLAIDPRIHKGLGRREAGHDIGGCQPAHVEQLDLHRQRLVQLRLEGHLPKLQRLRHTGGQRRGGRYC